MSHGEIKVKDFKGYSLYVCADCGQNINNPHCFVNDKKESQPIDGVQRSFDRYGEDETGALSE